MALSEMKRFLFAGSVVNWDKNGELESFFPFEYAGMCPRCHESLVIVCGLKECPSCPVIEEWLDRSRRQLVRARAAIAAKPIKMEIVADPAKGGI